VLVAVKFSQMELITKKSILELLPYKYATQYPQNSQFFDGSWSDDKIKLLKAEVPLTEERANEILGNNSWTRNKCDECNNDVYATVQLGQEPDYESATANICLDCLKKAVKLARS
jgi:hypothetical protein